MKQTKIITLLILAFFLGGCGSDKKSEPEATLSVTPTEIILPSTANANQIISIQCNSSWTVSGTPDWLQISSISGNGNSSIVITARTANESSNSRSANLLVNAGEKSQVITVQQESGLSSCYVEPESLISLSGGVAFLSSKHGNVKNYRVGYLKASDYNKFTQKELLELTRKFTAITEFNKVESIHMLEANTEYYLLTLAYDMNDQEGELHKAAFTTKPSGDSQSIVTIGDECYYTSNNEIEWYAYPNGSTDKYYTMFLSGLSIDDMANLLFQYDGSIYYDNVKLAWYLNKEIERKSDYFKTKKGDAEIVETYGYYLESDRLVKRGQAFQLGYSVFFTWGVNISNDQLSGLVDVNSIYLEYNSVSKRKEIKELKKFNGKTIKVQKD